MYRENSFIKSLKVDKSIIARINEASHNNSKNTKQDTSKRNSDDEGRERSDDGPASEAGNPVIN